MKKQRDFSKRVWVLLGLNLIFVANLAGAESIDQKWKCIELLNEQTRKDLASCEEIFVSRYQIPREYEEASEKAKNEMVDRWIKEVQGNDYEKAVQAAASLGIAKAHKAVRVLERVASEKKGSNRVRWVVVRSLGQIGDKHSIRTLIGFLDHQNWNVRTYAKVSLTEISGVYFGSDKTAWHKWQRNPDEAEKISRDRQDVKSIEKLRRAIDEKYSYRDLREVDWEKLFKIYERKMERAQSSREFAQAAAKLLSHAKDMHVWVKIGNETIEGFRRNIKRNYDLDILKKTVPNWQDRNDRVSTGRFDDGIGYIMISSWSRKNTDTLKAAFEALGEFADAPGLFIDVRPNAGGAEPLAQEFASCFIDKPVVYAKHVYQAANEPNGFSKPHNRVLKPKKARPKYRGKVVVLMGPVNMSSCEAFLLMMKQVPNCKLVGDTSYGSSGNPKPTDLGNGVTVFLPSWKAMRPDGTCFEAEGIKPDVIVKAKPTKKSRRDPVLQAALKLLRGAEVGTR